MLRSGGKLALHIPGSGPLYSIRHVVDVDVNVDHVVVVVTKRLPYLPGRILNGSGFKHIQSIQSSLGNGLQLLPGIGLEHHSPVSSIPTHQYSSTIAIVQ